MIAHVASRPALCVVNPFQHGGGAEYQIACLLDVLARRGHLELHYLARHVDPRVPQGHYRVSKIGRGNGVPRWGYVTDAVPLYRALSALDPRVIYQRVAGGYTGICAWYARRHACRMVWHLSSDNDVSLDNAFGDRNPLRRWLERRSVHYGLRHAHRIVAQTTAQSELMRRNFGRAADLVVPNFHPSPGEDLDKSGPLTVVWVSNLKPLKRPEVFVELARGLRDLPQVRFVMVGAPADAWGGPWARELMQAIATTPGLEFLGIQPQSEVNALLARAHVFVNTSTREGFPNTFIQAWLRGVPVLSLDVDPDGILQREQVGVLAGSPERLAQALREFLVDPTLREAHARRALAYASRAHSMQNAETLADLLESEAR